MILYHGSNMIVEKPQIIISNRFLDFGFGFYTTTNKNQAVNFADKVTNRVKSGKSTINIYSFPDDCLNGLHILKFDTANSDWLDFVCDNRNGIEYNEKYDIVYGPVADDDVYRTFMLYQSGVLTKQQTLDALKIKKLFNQFVFTSEKSIKLLKYETSEYGQVNYNE